VLQLVAHNTWANLAFKIFDSGRSLDSRKAKSPTALEVQECYEFMPLNRLVSNVKRGNPLISMPHFWLSIGHDKIEVQGHWVVRVVEGLGRKLSDGVLVDSSLLAPIHVLVLNRIKDRCR